MPRGNLFPRGIYLQKTMIKKYKKESNVSYALGATLVMELLKNKPQSVRGVYLSPKADVAAVTEYAQKIGVPITVSEKAFNILSPKENCYAIGVFDKFDCAPSAERHHVVLVNPSNCGNLGTIMRAAAAFDCADLIIIRPAADPFDPKTVRASMGAVFDIAFSEFDDFSAYTAAFPEHEIVPFMLDGAPFAERKFDKDKKYSFVFGNEATGLPQSFSEYGAARIEQSPKVDSLNLSVAVSVALYRLYTE